MLHTMCSFFKGRRKIYGGKQVSIKSSNSNTSVVMCKCNHVRA